jgi:muramidase (phage lysozyme)
MSIFKDTFKPEIQAQLKIRQEAIFERTPVAVQYFNSRNAWVRMTSAVNIGKGEGTNTSATKHVLQGGMLKNSTPNIFQLRSGIGNEDAAYSNQTPDNNSLRLGIRPMPGITSVEVRSKSAYGSLREIIINFNAWDIKQLEELELLYMRPGYTVLVEWGWAPYLDNNKQLQNNILFYNDVLYGGKNKEDIWKELFNKASKDGNYDAIYGFIKNYSWNARPDGGYDCTTTIITMGEIIESLKINYTPADSNIAKNGIFGFLKQFESQDTSLLRYPISGWFKKEGPVKKSYSQNIIAGICNELYRILVDVEGINNFEEKKWNNWTFFRFNVDVSNSQNNDNDFDNSTQVYILLKDFIDILNKYVVLQDNNKKPISEISVYEGNHMGGNDKPLLCLGSPLQLSVDPTVCLIKNDAWLNPISLGFEESGFEEGIWDDFDTLKNIIKGLKNNYWYNNEYIKTQLGIIGNIYVNLGYLYSLSISNNLASQDKKEKNDIALFDFLKNMMTGINTSIGNVSNFEIFSDPIDSVTRIIDINFTSPDRSKEFENAFQFEIHNTKSIIRNYRLESQIFQEQSSIISIGAQAEGGALGEDVNTLIDFNKNLTDRIIPKKDSPYNINKENKEEQLKEKIKNLKENINIIIEYINEIDPNWYNLFGSGNFDVNNASKYANALKDVINFFKTYVQNDNKNRSIIPTKLSIEMDGIGGLVIGNIFRIPEEILPKGYKGIEVGPSKIGYIVTGIKHSIQNNDWVTTIDAQFIILDEPKGGLTISDVSSIKTTIKEVTSSSQLTGSLLPSISLNNKTGSFGIVSNNIPLEARPLLDVIAVTEGTAGVGQNGYDILVGYGRIPNWNSNYENNHPNIKIYIPSINNYSTAAGRYQFLNSTWKELGFGKFDKENQDKGGWKLITNTGFIAQDAKEIYTIAKSQIQSGKISVINNSKFLKFLDKTYKIWASLPNSTGFYGYSNQGGKYNPAGIYKIYIEAIKKY